MNHLLLWLSRHAGALLAGVFLLFLCSSLVLYSIVEDLDNGDAHHPTDLFHQLALDPRRHKFGGNKNELNSNMRHSDPHQKNGNKIHPPPSKALDSARAKYESQNQHLDAAKIEAAVQKLRLPESLETVDQSLSYDIRRCPKAIPKGYPAQWSVLDVLSHWNPDDTTIPSQIYQGLCTIDWRKEEQRQIASTYRKAELPFLVHHHAEIWETVERWSHHEYVQELLPPEKTYRNEHSENNHMMYWKVRNGQKALPWGWKAPTENVELTYDDWYKHAQELEQNHNSSTANTEHWYFRLNGDHQGKSEFLYDELPLFDPKEPSFFMVDPKNERGINCRFGSKGIIAELHYDYSRNFILILKGQKRYILAHPTECPNLELHPAGHPSARHSRVNWSDPKDWHTGNFANAQVNEVVVEAGDILYLPTSWFHFIVSLNLNYQCNARSGVTHESEQIMRDCGF